MQTSHSNALDVKLSLSLQSTLREKEGKEEGNSSIFKSSVLCHGWRVISRLQLCSQFIFQLNYGNDVKIWLLKLLFKNN